MTRFDESVEEISLPAGGGGTSSATSISLKNQGDTVYNVARGSKVELRILFTSTEDGQSTGTGAATITVNNAVKAASVPVANGTVTALDVTDYLDKKIEIMKTYESEIDASPFPRNEDAIRGLASYRGATAHYKYSEAFYLVRSRVDSF